jgi:hypothetical protein
MKRKSIILVSFFLNFLLLFTGVELAQSSINAELSNTTVESGLIYLSNTTTTDFLFAGFYQALENDIDWNLTIQIDSNSSSGIVYTLHDPLGTTTVNGEVEFHVQPGETRSLVYKHEYIYNYVECSCEAPEFNFRQGLTNTAGSASGSFTLEGLGYTPYVPPTNPNPLSFPRNQPDSSEQDLDPVPNSTGFNFFDVSLLSFALIGFYLLIRKKSR